MTQNASLVSIDVRFNPGATSDILKKVAYQMIRNIATMLEAGTEIQERFINRNVVYHKEIPKKVYS